MAGVEKRSVSLSSELAAVVDEAVSSGEFGSASEVVRDALRQWKERRDLLGHTLEEIRALWDQGINSGESVDGEEAFSGILARLDAKAKARLAR